MALSNDWKEFIGLLNSKGVEYLLVGGHAVAFHSKPRMTGDIDFFLRRSQDNAERTIEALDDFGFSSLGIKAEDLLKADSVIQLGVEPGRIDLLTDLSGLSFEEAWAHRVEGKIEGVMVSVISVADLSKNKRALARPQDLADVEAIEGRS